MYLSSDKIGPTMAVLRQDVYQNIQVSEANHLPHTCPFSPSNINHTLPCLYHQNCPFCYLIFTSPPFSLHLGLFLVFTVDIYLINHTFLLKMLMWSAICTLACFYLSCFIRLTYAWHLDLCNTWYGTEVRRALSNGSFNICQFSWYSEERSGRRECKEGLELHKGLAMAY